MGERPRTNLRAALTSFVGRDADVGRVAQLVGEYRLATLTGPGGSGKTRLASEAARTLLDRMPDGVWLVELAPVGAGVDVSKAVLAALGLRDQVLPGPGQPGEPIDRLAAALGSRDALLVLDNCEHVVGAAATLADRLLGECPGLRILTTSREPLGITGEALWPVEPLAGPPADAGVAEAMSSAAVRLLIDRARAARPGFALSEGTVPAVVRICRALDGMPLAIELAAARLRTMTPEELASRLDDRFRVLTGGSRTALPRHRTLRAVVDWSWELLTDAERALLRRLAVFSGGATVAAAERVCADEIVPADEVLDLLAALTDKSLLIVTGDDEPRYRMLETIKAYGIERLDEAGERDRTRRAHADYFAELAETADPYLRRAEQLVWLRRLAAEHDNINAAVRAAVAAGDAQAAIRLAAAAGWYWWLGGHKAEGTELVAAALTVTGDADSEAHAMACAMAMLFATAGLGDERAAGRWLAMAPRVSEEARERHPLLRFVDPLIELVRSAREGMVPSEGALNALLDDEDPWVRAQARINRGRLVLNGGDGDTCEAQADIEQALATFRALGERWGISFALTSLADLAAARGELAKANEYYEEAIVVVRDIGAFDDLLWMRGQQARVRWLLGDRAGSAAVMAQAERDAERVNWPDALAGLARAKAELARWAGDTDTARTELAHAEALTRQITVHPVFLAMLRDSLAYLDSMAGDLAAARTHRAEALTLALESKHVPTIGQVLVGVADLAMRLDRPRLAACLLAAGDAVRGGPDLSFPDAARIEAAARSALGDDEFAEAARSGQDATIATVREIASSIVEI